nr:hypothetical protein [Acidobacteriota bacterium]NIM62913.1 hypothetical protein [Acidobacteriota bacterium]NIO60778.1 hypothetical protein [Acidobacteriota bacterium]NIQ87193.1 hypothetical protein [Acidobacteriota bacterium]NIT12444.1 hypothetical protein [Acidobacteriota bacterium]
MSRVIPLGRERFADVVEVLSDAFRDYPVMRYILADAGDDYETRLAALVGYFTESRFARRYPVLGIEGQGRLVAAANINPPRSVPAPPELKTCYETFGETIGPQAITRFRAFADACEPLEPDEPHYYLGMIGVARGAQGKGHARVLLDALHEMSDRDEEST